MNNYRLLISTIFIITMLFTLNCCLQANDLFSYYRLRVELATNSSACQFMVSDGTLILSGRQIRISGEPKKAGISFQRLWVASQNTGQQVGVTGDYAIAPEAIDQPLSCQLINTIDGMTSVRIYAIQANGDSVLIHQINSFAADTLNFAIDLTSLQSISPLQKAIKPIMPQKLLCAFYYPWYYSGDWNSRLLQDHPVTLYSSDDSVAIEQHILQAKNAGVDVFLSSWWGPGSYTDQNLVTLLEQAQQHDFLIAINFETLTVDPTTEETIPLDDATILAWLKYAIRNYGSHPSFLKVADKPVFVLWASGTVADFSWQNIFTQLDATGHEATFIGMFNGEQPALNVLDFFDGLHTYNILGVIQSNDQVATMLAQTYANLGKVLHYYPLLTDGNISKIWAATVQPGYDDHLIPGRTTPILPRENGNLYRNTLAAAVNSNPDWIFITTWNEWWEHTYIEPSENYGEQYLQLTREYAELWKGQPVAVTKKKTGMVSDFTLRQNYPNPFNPNTTIEFALPKSALVTLKVYNLLGEEVATLVAEQRLAGIHRFNWDARGLASGVYLYRMEAMDPLTGFPNKSGQAGQVFVQAKKLILMR